MLNIHTRTGRHRRWSTLMSLIAALSVVVALVPVRPYSAFALQGQQSILNTPAPSSVTIAGDLQSELGCSGDWQPDCANTHLTYDANDDVWQGTFNVPAGNWHYKAALNNSWDENYGQH